ncbi:nose resistant to fluoxetine protein 6-like [Harmonia axyridis]|uniref:nose resistant to fluoxetine protein 6-like n=1 Tax=Harmonia axyridis TaxID=115357 RepID=UPI001E2783A4|nr:nose resistant to fluoxetine protein 6-like [Harmonia axyridis]
MRFTCCILVICFDVCYFFLGATASTISQELSILPRIFYVNETEECPDDHYYCKVDVKLKPKNVDDPPELWKLIKKESIYRRDTIFRAFCIGGESIEEKLEQELLQYNLTGDVSQLYCDHKRTPSDVHRPIETFIGLFIFSYMGFIIFSTIKTSNQKKDANKYQKMFSTTNVWREINKPNRNEDFNKLLSIQGIRTFAMVFIIGVHSFFTAMTLKFVRNPEYFEDAPNNLLMSVFYGSFGLIVQVYFIISSWLLSVQLNKIVENNGDFSWKDLLLLWLNRYLRLLPTIAVLLLLHSSDILAVCISHPYFYSMTRAEVKRCGAIWWKNLLFMQNINVQENEICSPGMWYLAVDFQMYTIVSAFFFISRKFKISMNYFFGLIAAVSALMQTFYVLTTEFGGLLRFGPRLLPPETFISNPETLYSYIKPYGSAITYIIGFIFGTIYWHNKNKNIFGTIEKKLLFYGAFIGFPILACYLYELRSNRAVEALLTVTLRPLFSLGIAVGILGMATGSGGYIKKFFENSSMVFFGNFTYSIYMSHFLVVFGRAVFEAKYVEVDDFYLFSNWILDVILSYLFGMYFYILLEHPFIKLQKNLVPQISSGKKEEKSKTE